MALAPIETGRGILNGTFTHPSPVAGLVYTGSTKNRPITRLVERLDGNTLFGLPVETLTPEAFTPLALRLRISTVVALDEDRGRLPFVETNPAFDPPHRTGPFLIFSAKERSPGPDLVSPRRWRFQSADSGGEWVPTSVAYYPLWHAETPAGPLPVRPDSLGLIQVKAPPGKAVQVDLVYRAGWWERLGVTVSVLGLIMWAGTGWRRSS